MEPSSAGAGPYRGNEVQEGHRGGDVTARGPPMSARGSSMQPGILAVGMDEAHA